MEDFKALEVIGHNKKIPTAEKRGNCGSQISALDFTGQQTNIWKRIWMEVNTQKEAARL